MQQKQLNELQFNRRKENYKKIEAIVSKFNVRYDREASPITGLVYDAAADDDNEAGVLLRFHPADVREYLQYRDSFLALSAAEAEAKPAPAAEEAAPAELTIEQQIEEIRKVERARRRAWEENERRWHDESLSSILVPEPSVEAVRAKYPEAAAELDARRAKAAEERERERAERVSKIDPWNI